MLVDDFSPPPDLKRKVLDAAASTPAPTRSRVRVRNIAIFGAAACVMAEIFFYWGGMRAAPRPAALIIETALGAACIAAVAMWTAYGRGRSMQGRSSMVLGSIGLITPAALFVWKVYWSAGDPAMVARWPERVGVRCLRLSLLMAVWPFLAMLLIRRGSDPNHPRVTGASIGVAAGACAWVFTDLWCPVGFVPHLMLGHVLPIVLLAALGALLGRWLLSPVPPFERHGR